MDKSKIDELRNQYRELSCNMRYSCNSCDSVMGELEKTPMAVDWKYLKSQAKELTKDLTRSVGLMDTITQLTDELKDQHEMELSKAQQEQQDLIVQTSHEMVSMAYREAKDMLDRLNAGMVIQAMRVCYGSAECVYSNALSLSNRLKSWPVYIEFLKQMKERLNEVATVKDPVNVDQIQICQTQILFAAVSRLQRELDERGIKY